MKVLISDKNRSFGYPFYYKRPHFMTLIHLASHTELSHKRFSNKIHEMRIFETKKIVGTARVSCNQVGVLKVPLCNFKMK